MGSVLPDNDTQAASSSQAYVLASSQSKLFEIVQYVDLPTYSTTTPSLSSSSFLWTV